MGSYARTGYMAVIAEVTENTAVKPTNFVPFMSEDIVPQWGATPAMPISANRSRQLRPIGTAIEAPSGNVSIEVEPKTVGFFLKGIFGALTSGRYFPISSVSGTFTVGETITGGTSSATATILAVSKEADYLLVGAPTGTFTAAGEAITGGSSGATASLGVNSASVYGHQGLAPQNSLPTFTVEFAFDNEAYRYTGVRFHSIELSQKDNIITADVGLFARAVFHHGRVTAALASGSGSKTILLDQTTGLAASDTIKVFRPSTGAFLDFASSGVKTHSVGSVASETSIIVTDLQTSLVAGDLIVLAPQTASYSVDKEFSWIGGSVARLSGTSLTAALAAAGDSIEDFELKLTNEMEGRHGANGVNVINRFPAKNFLKGLTGEGKFNRTYTDMTYIDLLRRSAQVAAAIQHIGSEISTGINYRLEWRVPSAVFDAFNANMSDDDLLDQEMSFKTYYNSTSAFEHKVLLVNTTSSY